MNKAEILKNINEQLGMDLDKMGNEIREREDCLSSNIGVIFYEAFFH